MITGPTVAPIGDLTDSAGPTAGTISVELEEMPAIADGLDIVSRTCADRTMPILGIATETRLFLGINGRAQQAAALCTGLAADLGMSAAKFGVTAAAVRAAHSSYLQVENTVAGWFDSMGVARDGKLPDGRSTRDHFRGLIAGEPGEATYLLKLTIPELGYFSAYWVLPHSPVVAAIIFGFTAYMDAKWNPEIARPRIAGRLSAVTKIPQGIIEKVLAVGGVGIVGPLRDPDSDKKAHNMRTASADEYGVSAHSGEKDRLTVDASAERLQAAAKAQDQEFERSQQDPTKGERGAVLVTVMYEAGHEGDPAHALYVVSIPGTNFSSFGGSPMDIPGALREALGNDTLENPAYQMVLQALRDAGAPQGARVYMEGFSQGGMIAYNMANSTEVAKEINIVGVYAQASPLRGLPAKRRNFGVDYVEGDGDPVPDSALRPEGGWRPDERDTAITISNFRHNSGEYRETLQREGYGNQTLGALRAAMGNKGYVQGEQKVTSGSAMPDGYTFEERLNEYGLRGARYTQQALEAGVQLDPRVLYEGIDQLTDGELHRVDSVVRESVENTRQKIEDTVADAQLGMEIAKQRAEGLQREAGETVQAAAGQIPAVIEGVKKTLPHPEPTPQETPQNRKPAWLETPVPQMPNSGAWPAPNLVPAQPVLSAANLLGSNAEAPANRGFIVNAPQDTQPVSRMPMAPAEDIDPGFIVRPEAQPTPGSLAPRIIQGLPDVVESLPRIGDLTAMPHVVGGDRQGGDYDGGESIIPTLPDLKPAPAPMLPPKSIDPGFLAPAPPENIDPGFRAPGPPEDLTPIEEREPLMV
ncbi:extensin [Rothia mucilaginosa]|uniref:extensin n=1 Tax=Rothia mucilaginosa TaxID=43675 RepID=UPI003C7C30C0